MPDETNQAGTVDEQRKADEDARRAVRIQLEETERHETEKAANNMAALSDSQFRKLCRSQFGFDPGV